MKHKPFLLVLIYVFFSINMIHCQEVQVSHKPPDSLHVNYGRLWVDSILDSLTLDEKIAQLIWIRSFSNKDSSYFAQVTRDICDFNVGGITFFKGNPYNQLKITNLWQSIAKTPLIISMDAEWGLGMRLDSVYSFPRQMTLGAIQNNGLIKEMGKSVASQLCRMGVQVNFAPVIDVNSNPKNPVINSRSFGENRDLVALKALAYMEGLQENGIIATAKHFPGHGDTDKDSHYTLPVVNLLRKDIDSIHLTPYKALINNGLDAIMVAHLQVPSLDSTKNTPSSLSKSIITDL